MAMTAQDIESYLAELGLELQSGGVTQPVRLLMVGGAYMLTQIGNRSSTKDIDVLLENIPDPGASPLYMPLQNAVRAVAARVCYELDLGWDRIQHESCTQTLPFGCERRRMGLRCSVLDAAERASLATQI